jgi:hypothetical protein
VLGAPEGSPAEAPSAAGTIKYADLGYLSRFGGSATRLSSPANILAEVAGSSGQLH